MKCSQWKRVGLFSPTKAPGGIFASACTHRGRNFKMQILCGARFGQNCKGYVWAPDGTPVIGPLYAPNRRKLSGRLHVALDRWVEVRRPRGGLGGSYLPWPQVARARALCHAVAKAESAQERQAVCRRLHEALSPFGRDDPEAKIRARACGCPVR